MKKSLTIAIVVLFLGGLGYLAYNQFTGWHVKKLAAAKQRERNTWADNTRWLEERIVKLQDELKKDNVFLSDEKLLETFGEKPILFLQGGVETRCEDLERQILAFLSYLDRREYTRPYNWKHGAHGWFQGTASKLSGKLPVISGETKNLYSLMKNMSHFYSILGKRGIEFVMDILYHESDILEPASALFYEWFISGDRCEDTLGIRPPNKVMYEYAGFLLNTLAGRSYLLRRDSTVQALSSYYAVLIIHRANERRENEYGIDIRPYLGRLWGSISNHRGLSYRKYYLENLSKLMEKYELK